MMDFPYSLSKIFSVPSVSSVLNLFGIVFNRRREEPVGPVRGCAGPEEAVRVDETLRRDAFAQNSLQRASRSDDAKFTLRAAKCIVHDEFVFFRLERAGGVDQLP